jgi:predicted Fe-Mo cluster-binding NifX family protein
MKIVVSSPSESLEDNVDSRFGRCKYFLLIETEDKNIVSHKAFENQGNIQMHGAGIKAAEQVGELKADKLITGNLGPNASNVINQLGIEVYQASGSIKKAINDLLDNNLEIINSTVRSHFGMQGGNRK